MKKRINKKTFAEKIRTGEKTILYELLPPPANVSKKDIYESFSMFTNLLSSFPVDGINIPEVREEKRNGKRADNELSKMQPVNVCKHLRSFGRKDFIINKPIVYNPWETQKQWLKNAYHKNNIKNFVFVGGESSKISYPGISVSEAAQKITTTHKKDFPEICLGGIVIPTRENEEKRILNKAESGIEFFTTQIIYETSAVKKLLKKYWKLCKKSGVKAKMIFLSFAPITSRKDIELLLWLGVKIPKKTLNKLLTGWLGMAERSIQICQQILQEILEFVKKEGIDIPLGINVEHINRHNFELSFLLLKRLSNIYL